MADLIRGWLTAKHPDPNNKCESPIEALFYAALEHMTGNRAFPCAESFPRTQQAKIGQYRADFLFTVVDPSGAARKLVVELDGHDFHERTKEQASRDKARDRFMTAQGIQVVRFTGSEIWANPLACAEDVLKRCYVIRHGVEPRAAMAKAHLDDLRKFFEAA